MEHIIEQDELNTLLDFEVPENLYVPTPPLWIESQGFRGPLDLLWYLIREQDIDILDIPLALIAAQYLEYIKIMTAYRFEIAPDYLVMAVRLMQIKSQMLLPKKPVDEVEEDDPRVALMKQLTDYSSVQSRSLWLDKLPRWGRDVWPLKISLSHDIPPPPEPLMTFVDLKHAYQSVLKKQGLKKVHEVIRPLRSLTDSMTIIICQLSLHRPKKFIEILDKNASVLDVAVCFQACLELAKDKQIELHQDVWQELLWLNRIA
jgi:segregation and condensation protein A